MHVFEGIALNEKNVSLCLCRLVSTCPFIGATSTEKTVGCSGVWLPLDGLGSLPQGRGEDTPEAPGRGAQSVRRVQKRREEGPATSIVQVA